MDWHAGLMYFSMEGEHSSFLIRSSLCIIPQGCDCSCLLICLQLLQILSTVQRWLTTAPGSPTTHWYQLRCVLPQPIYVVAGQEMTGRLHLIAHNAQSYTIYLTLSSW